MAIEGFFQMEAKTSPYLRANINIGCLMDILTGAPVLGEHGRYITNGGHNGSVVIVGPGNSYNPLLLTILVRFVHSVYTAILLVKNTILKTMCLCQA